MVDISSAPPQSPSTPACDALSACSDETVLEQIGAGDRAAFTTLYDRVAGPVYGLIHQIVIDESAADRVTQDVLLAVWTSAQSFDRSAVSARGWILGIAHRHAVEEVRGNTKAARLTVVADDPPSDARGSRYAAFTQPLPGGVDQALRCLSPSQRCALELVYFHGLNYWQVARMLDISRSTASSTLRDALRRLAMQSDAHC